MESGKTTDGDDDRPNALLTSDQRRYLEAPEEYALTDSARWKKHSRIRERLRQTIYDFALLGGRKIHHKENNWERLNLSKSFDDLSHQPASDGVRAMFYALYRGLSTGHVPFEPLLQDGVAMAELHMNNRHVNPTFTIEARTHGNVIVDSALSKINADEVDSLRIPEMRAVLQKLADSDVDVAELVWDEYDGDPVFGDDRE